MSNENSPYTPGPWTHTGQGDITGVETNGANHGPVDVCCVYLRAVPGRAEANARLIAAAPDLLESLRDILRIAKAASLSHGVSGHAPRIARAEAAIAKATGGRA